MATQSDAAKCPFYECETPMAVYCEGVTVGSRLKIMFPSSKDASVYKRKFCNRISGCRDCPIHIALLTKYV